MRKIALYIALLLAITTFVGCKTTEANYKQAYERALAKQNEGYSDELLDNMRREEAIPRTVYRGDSIPLKAMYFNTLKENDSTPAAKRFNVVTGMFAQKFNALSAVNRLRESGYPDALVLLTGDKKYFISAHTTINLDSAVAHWREISAQPPYPLSSPFPYILQRP